MTTALLWTFAACAMGTTAAAIITLILFGVGAIIAARAAKKASRSRVVYQSISTDEFLGN